MSENLSDFQEVWQFSSENTTLWLFMLRPGYTFQIPQLPVTVYSPLFSFNLSAAISYFAEILINAQEAHFSWLQWRQFRDCFFFFLARITKTQAHVCSLHVSSRRTRWHRHFVTHCWKQTALLAGHAQQWREKLELLEMVHSFLSHTHTHTIFIYSVILIIMCRKHDTTFYSLYILPGNFPC